MRELKSSAKASANSHIINMLQRPGQLEKIDQIKLRLVRKKASLEALLKSAMQNQFNGVVVGLQQLHLCLQETKEVDARFVYFCLQLVSEMMIDFSLKAMNAQFSEVPALCNKLNDVREENMRHSQYVTAKENLKHIFTVPDSVQKTKTWINEGKLLHAHQVVLQFFSPTVYFN